MPPERRPCRRNEPGLADIHVQIEDISITNPGDNSGAHESLQHAVLVDGIHGHVRVSLTNCDVFGCIHENGCGVSVRHGAFCEIGHRTRVRECHTGIKVDSLGYIDCVGCEIYGHLLSGLLITNAVRAEAYADLLSLPDRFDGYHSDSSRSSHEAEDEGRKEEKDGRADAGTAQKVMTAEEAEVQRLSQLQVAGPAPFSYIRGMIDRKGRVSRVTDISSNGDCSVFVSDGGRLRIDKGTNIYGNRDRGVHVEDRNSVCEVHELVSIHHNTQGNVYWIGDDGSVLRRYEKRRQRALAGGPGSPTVGSQIEDSSKKKKRRGDILFIEEPLQWWRKPYKLLDVLPRALQGSTQDQLSNILIHTVRTIEWPIQR